MFSFSFSGSVIDSIFRLHFIINNHFQGTVWSDQVSAQPPALSVILPPVRAFPSQQVWLRPQRQGSRLADGNSLRGIWGPFADSEYLKRSINRFLFTKRFSRRQAGVVWVGLTSRSVEIESSDSLVFNLHYFHSTSSSIICVRSVVGMQFVILS